MPSADRPADRAYVAARLTQLDHRLDQAREAMAAELDLYRDDWSTRHAEQARAHRERMDATTAEQAEWLRNFYTDGDADESAPTNVDRQTPQDASASGGPATPGPGSAGQPLHAAELAEAERIRALPMAAWAEERQRYLDRANQGLFG